MDAFALQELSRRRAAGQAMYLEVLRVPELSAGLSEIPVGDEDRQSPPTEDELYYVCSGRATIRVGEEDRPVGPGSFVAAGVAHRVHSIEEDRAVLVVFEPAEDSRLAALVSEPSRDRRLESQCPLGGGAGGVVPEEDIRVEPRG